MNSSTSFDSNSAAYIGDCGINIFLPESHVAQQRRRDKLRDNFPQPPAHHLQDIRNHFLHHLPIDSGSINPDQDSPMFSSSEMLNLMLIRNPSLGHSKDPVPRAEQSARPVGLEDACFTNTSRAVSSSFGPLGRVAGSPFPFHWNRCDSVCNYSPRDNALNQDLLYDKEVNFSSSSSYAMPGYSGRQSANSVGPTSKQCSVVDFSSETRTPPTLGTQAYEMVSHVQRDVQEASNRSWHVDGSEMVPRPSYENDVHVSRVYAGETPVHKLVGGYDEKFGTMISKSKWDVETSVNNSTSRGLSLSLSSHPSPSYNATQFGPGFGSEDFQGRSDVICSSFQNTKSSNSSCAYSDSKSSIIYDGLGNSHRGNVGSSTNPLRSIGPLGPFTGYATILKNSKFLKPAQHLLDDTCGATGSLLIKTCDFAENDRRESSISSSPCHAENDSCGRNSALSPSFDSPTEAVNGSVTSSCQTYRPLFQQKRAKLLFMQEEICRKYKLYHQQMQMAVGSFESVVGLSSAAPYTSLAFKSVARHFRFLRSAISDQLRNISKALGEDISSPSTGTCSKGDMDIPRFKCIDQSLQRHRAGFLEPQHPIWRPQRGLPERAVSVLRAWLFEHFLHPYPTDSDKQMLASQTGLSRNQVSNWFINARVRIWKPMVEEMHTLDSNASAETEPDSGKDQRSDDQPSSPNRSRKDQVSDKQPQWSSEKRCKTTGGDGSSMGFLPYQRALGAVSLTLGLRHSSEQREQHQLRRHYGGQVIHDFVG